MLYIVKSNLKCNPKRINEIITKRGEVILDGLPMEL